MPSFSTLARASRTLASSRKAPTCTTKRPEPAAESDDLAGSLGKIVHLVDDWMLTDLPLPRAAKGAELAETVWSLTATAPSATPKPRVSTFASPAQALAAALAQADPTDRIVVFGSFYTVGGVLKDGPPRLVARHLG